jgi:hypothetical protein
MLYNCLQLKNGFYVLYHNENVHTRAIFRLPFQKINKFPLFTCEFLSEFLNKDFLPVLISFLCSSRMSLNSGRQLNLSSLQQVLNEETKPEFLRRLDAVYWDARQMEENFAHYGGKVCSFV